MINNSTTAASTFVEVTTLAEEHAGQQTVNDSSDSGHSRSAQIMTELVFEVIIYLPKNYINYISNYIFITGHTTVWYHGFRRGWKYLRSIHIFSYEKTAEISQAYDDVVYVRPDLCSVELHPVCVAKGK